MAKELRLEQGKLTIAGGKERYVLVPLRIFAEIYNTLEDVVGTGAGAVAYMMGKRIGKGLAEELIRRTGGSSDLKHNVEKLIELLSELGFGRFELVEADGKRFVIRMYEGPTSEFIKNTGKASCHLERGLIAGVLEEVLGCKCMARETKCRSAGSPYCEIVVEKMA